MGGSVAAVAAIAPVIQAVSSLVGATNIPAAPGQVAAPAAPVAPEATDAEPEGVLDAERLRARALRRQAQGSQRKLVGLQSEESSNANTLLGS